MSKLDLNSLNAAQLFLILIIINLQAMNVVEMYFSVLFDRCVQKEALQMVNVPFDKTDRTEAVVALLRDCLEVNLKQFNAEIELQ